MTAIKRPQFLVLPAYLIGLLIVFVSVKLMPQEFGAPLAALLVLAMITPASLLHPHMIMPGNFQDTLLLSLALWLGCAASAAAFAYFAIPVTWGPAAITGEAFTCTWLQLSFLVLQQVFYFGVHAFNGND